MSCSPTGFCAGWRSSTAMLNLGIDLSAMTIPESKPGARSRSTRMRPESSRSIELRIGKTSAAEGADLAVHYYGIQLAPAQSGLSVEVENHGTDPSQPGTLQCWTRLGRTTPSTTTRLPGDLDFARQDRAPRDRSRRRSRPTFRCPSARTLPRRARLPVQCQVSAPGEVYPDNDEAERVLSDLGVEFESDEGFDRKFGDGFRRGLSRPRPASIAFSMSAGALIYVGKAKNLRRRLAPIPERQAPQAAS